MRELEQAGVVRRHQLPPPAASRIYELTQRGLELEPVVLALGRWGSRAGFPAEPAAFGPDSAVLALKTLFSPQAANGLHGTYGLRFGQQRFTLRVSEAQLGVERGDAPEPDAIIDTDPATLARLLWHDGRLSDEVRAGRARIEGNRRSVQQLLRLFPLPA